MQHFSLLLNLLGLLEQSEPQSQEICESLYDVIQSLPQKSKQQQLLKTNYFCMISIARQFKLINVEQILSACLIQYMQNFQLQKNPSQTYKPQRFILLMTRFNIIATFIKKHKFDFLQNEQKRKLLDAQLQKILTEHLGQFHILKKMIEKSEELDGIVINYELVLVYVFSLLRKIYLFENENEKVELYRKAIQRIQKKSTIVINVSNKSEQMKENVNENTSNQIQRQNSEIFSQIELNKMPSFQLKKKSSSRKQTQKGTRLDIKKIRAQSNDRDLYFHCKQFSISCKENQI